MAVEARPSRLRRIILIILGVVGLAIAIPAAFIIKLVLSQPKYENVVSIEKQSVYQDAALLERAWTLPVAAKYGSLNAQSNGSVCGPSSLSNALRSLAETETTEALVLEGTGQCRLGFCLGGLTLDELAEVARAKADRPVTVIRDIGLEEFRRHLRLANDPAARYVINFTRGPLFGRGGGHHSPIGGYFEAEDLVFVLDTNATYKPWLVSSARLFEAMDTVDPSSGKKRGLLRLGAEPMPAQTAKAEGTDPTPK